MSLSRRLLIATAVTMLCALAVVDVATYVLVSRAQLQQVDATLERAALPVGRLAVSPLLSDRQAIPIVAPGLFVAIIGADGSTEFQVGVAEPGRDQDSMDLTALTARAVQTIPSTQGDEVRVRLQPLRNGALLIVGESLQQVNDTRSTLVAVLLGASLAAIVVAMAVGWWLLRAGLLPLRRVELSASAIGGAGLADQRVPGATEATEVGRLAVALNAMLDRLEDAGAERERTLAELRESEARMRRFVADASHELRTPIAATAAYAELFEHGARDRPADLERAMSGIRHETDRMGELVDDLLLLARLDENRPLAADPVDLTEIVLAAVDAARTLEPGRTIRPHVTDVVTVSGDRLRLRQVVDNLLTNVRAHTPTGAACTITLTRTSDGLAELTIADTGPGVPNEVVDRLFDRFYRLDDARSRSTGGSGLGLSIVQAIVRAHGGTISAANAEPHGLIVTVRLPAS